MWQTQKEARGCTNTRKDNITRPDTIDKIKRGFMKAKKNVQNRTRHKRASNRKKKKEMMEKQQHLTCQDHIITLSPAP